MGVGLEKFVEYKNTERERERERGEGIGSEWEGRRRIEKGIDDISSQEWDGEEE